LATSTSHRSEPEQGTGRRIGGWWLAVILAVAIPGLLFWATRSPLFRMRHLEVTGTVRLSTERIAQLGGLGDGSNVFWMDLGWVEQRIEADPWVADATVGRSLPGSVHVNVVERTPVAAVGVPDAWWTVAADGTVLEELGQAPADLPTVVLSAKLADREPLEVGAAPAWLRGAAEAATMFSLQRLDAIRLLPHGQLTLRLADGEVVLLGPAEELAEKAAALQAVLDWSVTEGEPLVTIDLRSPRAPAAMTAATIAAQQAAEAQAQADAEGDGGGSLQNGGEDPPGGDGGTG
jgi:cell division protein FtsQ